MNSELISIIVPIYNCESYLKKCIESIINQTYKNIEIILIDDGSSDKSLRICKEYEYKDQRIIVIHQANKGQSITRNNGINIAKGKYILFVDSDDYLNLDACENFSKYFNDEYDIIIGDCKCNNSKYAVSHSAGIIHDNVMNGKDFLISSLNSHAIPVVAWLNIYRRDFIIKNDLFFMENVYHEDIDFIFRVFYYANKIIYSQNCFYNYVIRENSITTVKNKTKHCADLLQIASKLNVFFKDKQENKLRKLINDFTCNCYLSVYRSGNLYKEDKMLTKKTYVLKNARRLKTILKSFLFIISPRIFCKIKMED